MSLKREGAGGEEDSFRDSFGKIYSSSRAVGMWESRRDFQGCGKPCLLGFPQPSFPPQVFPVAFISTVLKRCAGTAPHGAVPTGSPAESDSAGNSVAGGLFRPPRGQPEHRGDGS